MNVINDLSISISPTSMHKSNSFQNGKQQLIFKRFDE